MYKRIQMLIACVLLCSISHAQNKIAELSEYFYPFMEFEYTRYLDFRTAEYLLR